MERQRVSVKEDSLKGLPLARLLLAVKCTFRVLLGISVSSPIKEGVGLDILSVCNLNILILSEGILYITLNCIYVCIYICKGSERPSQPYVYVALPSRD